MFRQLHLVQRATHGRSGYRRRYEIRYELLGLIPDTPLAHKLLYEQGILHGDISYGNTFLSESAEDNVYGFLADLDLASIDDKALDKLPENTANVLKGQRGKGPRSVGCNKSPSPKS